MKLEPHFYEIQGNFPDMTNQQGGLVGFLSGTAIMDTAANCLRLRECDYMSAVALVTATVITGAAVLWGAYQLMSRLCRTSSPKELTWREVHELIDQRFSFKPSHIPVFSSGPGKNGEPIDWIMAIPSKNYTVITEEWGTFVGQLDEHGRPHTFVPFVGLKLSPELESKLSRIEELVGHKAVWLNDQGKRILEGHEGERFLLLDAKDVGKLKPNLKDLDLELPDECMREDFVGNSHSLIFPGKFQAVATFNNGVVVSADIISNGKCVATLQPNQSGYLDLEQFHVNLPSQEEGKNVWVYEQIPL